MKSIGLQFLNTCTISAKELSSVQHTLNQEIDRLIAAQKLTYNTQYAAINVPHDNQLIENIKNLTAQKLALNPSMLIVIGIGGSNLGTAAVLQALYGALYNEILPLKVYFADTVDSDYIHEIIEIAEKELSQNKAVLLNVISKSGITTETIANFQVFIEVLQKYHGNNYTKYIVITTDEGSILHEYAKQEHIDFLTIPEKVGGRYSVFSAVGLFPLAMLNVDITELCAGAQSASPLCTQKDYAYNPASTSAMILHILYNKGYTVHNTFLFSVALENMGKWYRQLMAESIGKKYDKNNVVVHNGMLPTVSIGSTDLHSVAQLYVSGPYTIFTTFVSVEHNNHDTALSYNDSLNTIAPLIQNKSLPTIMNAILEGTMRAYQNDNRPFVHMTIPTKNAYYIGQWMQIKMYEIIYLGFLMNINPFDQPQVELYKQETKKLLQK